MFAADKIANVIALRGAYAEEGEDVERAMPVDLYMQILLWHHRPAALKICTSSRGVRA